MNLRRCDGPPLVVGHRGAAALAPENTAASFALAVAAGADVVELDVSPGLRVGHSLDELPDEPLTLDEALEELRAHPIGLHLDVKLPGYEEDVLAAVRRHGVEERSYLSTAYAATARRVAALSPSTLVAIGYPRDRLGVSRLPWPPTLSAAGASALRQAMPLRVPVLVRWAHAGALSLHHALCSRAAVAVSHRLGAPVVAWTANDPAGVLRLEAAGVDAIVTDDPGMAVATLRRQ